jgi:hypothetical protein
MAMQELATKLAEYELYLGCSNPKGIAAFMNVVNMKSLHVCTLKCLNIVPTRKSGHFCLTPFVIQPKGTITRPLKMRF